MSESDKIGKGSNMSNEFVKSSENQLIDLSELSRAGDYKHVGVLVNGELVLHIHVNAQSVSIARSDSMLNKAEVSFSIHGEKMS